MIRTFVALVVVIILISWYSWHSWYSWLKSTSTILEVESDPMDAARRCLNLKDIKYPDDAYEHFREIHHVLDEFVKTIKPHTSAGYSGPWIEQYWIHHFKSVASHCDKRNFSDVFGPYIPLLLPWTDDWVRTPYKYSDKMIPQLQKLLRKDVAYITVVQNDQGLPGSDDPSHFRVKNAPKDGYQVLPNILVLSAGGYGHVPVPLMKQKESILPTQRDRKWLVSYTGTLKRSIRPQMNRYLKQRFPTKYVSYTGQEWRKTSQDSYFVLCPRGFGRTSYHVVETIQQGRIPIQVFSKAPWLPYERIFEEKIGFNASVDGLGKLMDKLEKFTPEEVLEREKTLLKYRESHFMPSGVMHQIELFMKDGGGDLVCRPLPAAIKD